MIAGDPIDFSAMGSGRMFTHNVMQELNRRSAAGDAAATRVLQDHGGNLTHNDAQQAIIEYNSAVAAPPQNDNHRISEEEKVRYEEEIQRLTRLIEHLREQLEAAAAGGGAHKVPAMPPALQQAVDNFVNYLENSPLPTIAELRNFIQQLPNFDAVFVAPVVVDINNRLIAEMQREVNGKVEKPESKLL